MATMSFITADRLIELIRSASSGNATFARIISSTRIGVGADPMHPSIAIDLSKEAVVSITDGSTAAAPAEPNHRGAETLNKTRARRRTGHYWLEVQGQREHFGSLREMLAHGLVEIERKKPGTLDKLALIKPNTKRIVARDKHKLFDSSNLCDEFGEQLMPGWWYGTNNSSQETKRWLQRAAECADMSWEEDVCTSLIG